MYRKLAPWLVALATMAVACGDTGEDAGADGSSTVTSTPALAAPTTTAGEGVPTTTGTTAQPATTTTTSATTTSPTTTTAATTTAAAAATTTEAGATTTMPDRSLEGSDKELEEVPQEELKPPAVVGEVPAALMQPVLADAARRGGVDVGAVQVLRAQAVQWNDGSLGCPEPGQSYTQAIVPGYWVEVAAGGTTLDYRLAEGGFFRICAGPSLGDGGAPDS